MTPPLQLHNSWSFLNTSTNYRSSIQVEKSLGAIVIQTTNFCVGPRAKNISRLSEMD